MFLVSGLGVAIGLALLAYALMNGRFIPPEGDLKKPIAFNIAVGIFTATQALLLPYSNLKDRGRARWRKWSIGALLFAFTVETTQQLRGIDPRFTQHGSGFDQALGGIFFLDALVVMTLFFIVVVSVMRRWKGERNDAVILSLRYAVAASFVGFGSGFVMSAVAGPRVGEASVLPVHALGFHGLQAVPLVALLLLWAGASRDSARLWTHIAGVSWILATLGVSWQTFTGVPLLRPSPAIALAAVFLAVYLVALGRATISSAAGMHSTRSVPERA